MLDNSDLIPVDYEDLSFDDSELTEGPTLRSLTLVGFQQVTKELDRIGEVLLIDKLEVPPIDFEQLNLECIRAGVTMIQVLGIIENVLFCARTNHLLDRIKRQLGTSKVQTYRHYREILGGNQFLVQSQRTYLHEKFMAMLDPLVVGQNIETQIVQLVQRLHDIQNLRLKIFLLFFLKNCRHRNVAVDTLNP
jgi:hypothetical protein